MVKLTYNKLSGQFSAAWCSQYYIGVLSHMFSTRTILTNAMLQFLKVPVIIGRLDIFILQGNKIILSPRKMEYLTIQLCAIYAVAHGCALPIKTMVAQVMSL